MGAPGELRGQILAENKQLKKLIAAFTVRPGMPTATEDQIVSGELEVELVPQGTLVERCRAGGAGIPAFYSATVAGTDLEKGKEVREFDGRRYVLEPAIKLDFALLRAYRADRAGNVQFRGGSQNLNPAFAKAARVAIVEVDEIVEVGGIPPELINLPGIFVSRVVKSTYPFDPKQTPQSNRRPSDKPREYNGKPALARRHRQARCGHCARGQLRQSRHRHSDHGVEFPRRPRRHAARRERRARLRQDGVGRRCRPGHVQRERPVPSN